MTSENPRSRFVIEKAVAAAQAENWSEILDLTSHLTERVDCTAEEYLFRALGLMNSGDIEAADYFVSLGLKFDDKSLWGRQLEFEIKLKLGFVEQAFTQFADFIYGCEEDGVEGAKALLVMRGAEYDQFDIAKHINETRDVIRNVIKRPSTALCIQFFNKPDTLKKVIEHLLYLNNSQNYALIFIQDNYIKSSNEAKYKDGYGAAAQVLNDWMGRLSSSFYSVEIIKNTINLGTAPTCRRLIDAACVNYHKFIFLEDDFLLGRNALDWMSYHLDNSLGMIGPWFVSAESIFFDAQHRSISEIEKLRLEALAKHSLFSNSHLLLDFVPSTCFASNSKLWSLCREFRSFTRGPESLSAYLRARRIKTIAPVVPRGCDIGMQHPQGYSVGSLGFHNVRENKKTILLSENKFEAGLCRLNRIDLDLLYSATCLSNSLHITQLEEEMNADL